MKGKQILTAFIILAALGAYYYFFEIKKKAGDESAKLSRELLLPGLAKTQAAAINAESADGKITLKKTNAIWEVTEPVNAPADSAVCEAVIARLSSEKYVRKLDDVNQEDFGLVPPQSKIMITGADGAQYGILFGPENPSGETAYAAISGNTAVVYTVQVSLKTHSLKKLFDWRDKRVLNLEGMDIDRIEVKLKEKKYSLAKISGEWKAVSQNNLAVRADKVEAMIAQVKGAEAKYMEEANTVSLSKRSLLPPLQHVSFYSGKTENRISFGKKDEKALTYFVRGTYNSDIMEIPESVYTVIPALDSLLEKRAVPFAQEKAVRLKVSYSGRQILALKKTAKGKPDSWEVKELKGFNAEEKKRISPSSIIYYLSSFEYKDKPALKPGADERSEYGIIAGDGIEVYGENKEALAMLQLGRQVEGKEEFYVKLPLTGVIYTVEKNFIQGLNLPGIEVK